MPQMQISDFKQFVYFANQTKVFDFGHFD